VSLSRYIEAILSDYRTIGDALWSRLNADRHQILWYYRALVEAFTSAGPTPLAEEHRNDPAHAGAPQV
jgi:hypothetical protein